MARKKTIKLTAFLKIPFYIFVAWALGFVLFFVRLPEPDRLGTLSAEAVVVLTGGPGRLEAGVALLKAGRSELMLVSGVHENVRPHELSLLTGTEAALFECCITLDYKATNTLGNAVETAKWVEARNIKSVFLVTADYHVQRSVVLFRKSLPDVTIVPFPVKTRMPVFKLAKEYNKYLATLIFDFVGF